MKRSTRAFCILTLFSLIMAQAVAQQIPEVATDQELLAGYCLGVAVQLKARSLQTGNSSLDAAIRHGNDEFISHFHAYLQALGIFSGARGMVAVSGILTARKRGEQDELNCDATRGVCVKRCYRPGDSFGDDCVKACVNADHFCVSTQRCSRFEALPF